MLSTAAITITVEARINCQASVVTRGLETDRTNYVYV